MMGPGSVLHDKQFAFQDGDSGNKLFLILGIVDALYVVAKTTSQQRWNGNTFGCQPQDRFHNFFLPKGAAFFKKNTWICLNEFYEFKASELVKKGLAGTTYVLCTVDQHLRQIQDCALSSPDISNAQAEIVRACLA